MARKAEVSAGLLVFRRKPNLEMLLAHPGGPYWARKDEGAWSIPKGLVEAGDDLLAAARRELAEETSFIADGTFIPLAPVKQKSGKTVHGFAIEGDFDLAQFASNSFEIEWPPRSGRRQAFPEVDRAAWFDWAEAQVKILPGQRPILERLKAKLDQGNPAAASAF